MSMTAYKAAKIVNAALEAAEVEKVLPPQMFYNYTTARIRAEKAPLIACDEEGKITEDGLNEWLAKYLEKKGVQVAPKAEEDYVI